MTLRPVLLLTSAIIAVPTALSAVPKSPTVVSGTVAFSQSGNHLTVTETSPSAVINWRDFSVAKGEIVQFVQPTAGTGILNRVTGGAASTIDGLVQANGQLMLLNPNGITIGASGRISAAGLLLTSSAIADADYLAGRYVFTGLPGQGPIVNHGGLEAAEGGAVVLSAPQVTNDGSISAHLGRVALGGAAGFTLDTTGDGLWKYQITEPAAAALVSNAGTIAADGGTVAISARTLDHAMRDVINNSGMIEARGVIERDGEIILDGGTAGSVTLATTSLLDAGNGHVLVTGVTTRVGGSISGGMVETSGDSLDVSLAHVSAGTWLLDPTDFVIDSTNSAAIQSGLASGDVIIKTAAGGNTVTGATAANGFNPAGNGDIWVNAALTWSSNNTLTLDSYRGVTVNAALSASGNTAGVTLKTNDGGAGGQLWTNAGGSVTLTGSTPSVSINGTSYTPISSQAGLQAMGLSTNYALVTDISLSGAFTPIGAYASSYTANLEGFGHAITGLSINDSSHNNLGLISQLGGGGTLRDLFVSGSVSAATSQQSIAILVGTNSGGTISNAGVGGSVTAGSGSQYFGGLAGVNNKIIANANSSATVTGLSGTHVYGGLVGFNQGINATVNQSYATGTVSAGNASSNVGGLVGESSGTVSASYWSGTLNGGSGTSALGGVVGNNAFGKVLRSYALGTLSAGSSTTSIGGVVGQNGVSSSVSQCYAAANVLAGGGSGQVGGLAGSNFATIAASYWDATVSGRTAGCGSGSCAGNTGVSAGTAYNSATYSGWTFAASAGGAGTWAMINGFTRPLLAWEYSTAISNPHQLQLATLAPAANYTLANSINLSVTANANDVWQTTTGFVPIGFSTSGGNTAPTAFTGSFNGNGHSITNLSINNSAASNLGLFSDIGGGGLVQNLFVSGSVSAGAGISNLGILAGQNAGTVSAVGAAGGTVSAGSASLNLGGLVGSSTGTLSQDFASVAVSGGSGAQALGGLVGNNSSGIISQSYTSGSVTGGSAASGLGGLAGRNGGSILQSYAIGMVSGGSGTSGVGGLVGAGGGSVSAGYWDTRLSGQSTSDGGTGLASWSLNTDAAWTSGWTFISGHPFPLLSAFPYVPVTLSPASTSLTYGQATPGITTSTGTASDSSGVGSTSGLVVYPTLGGTLPVGSASVGIAGLVAAGYQIDFVPTTFTINPAPLTITANDASKSYGQAASSFSYTANGLLTGDSISSLSETSSGANSAAAAGAYGIIPAGAAGVGLAHYAITYVNGTLTVNTAPLTITAKDAGKTYGQTASFAADAFTTSGLLNGDSVTAVTQASTGGGAGAALGTYPITPSAATGSGLSNYSITYATGTLTVIPASLTIIANDATKTYGQTANVSGNAFTTSGLVNGDSVAGVTQTSGGVGATATVGTYSITPSAATGVGLGKYTITYSAGTLTVTPALLTITANGAAKTYGQAASFSGTAFTTSGLVNSDSVTAVTSASAGADATAAVGSYAITPSSAVGSGLANYSITYAPGRLTVNPAPLIITANDAATAFGQPISFAADAFSADGLRYGDSVTGVSETSSGAAANAAGSYPIIAAGATGNGLANYSITYQPGTLSVAPPSAKTVAAVITILTQPSGVSQPSSTPQATPVTQPTEVTPTLVTATPATTLAAAATAPDPGTAGLASTFIPTSQVDSIINSASLQTPGVGTTAGATVFADSRGFATLALSSLINGLVLQLMQPDSDTADASLPQGVYFPGLW